MQRQRQANGHSQKVPHRAMALIRDSELKLHVAAFVNASRLPPAPVRSFR
jgi:hypothetical protein